MTVQDVVLGVGLGLVAGVLSGLFGVGGGIVTTPGIQVLLGSTPIQAVATPLPIILPTSIVGAYTYWQAGEVDLQGATWAAVPGIAGAAAGAATTQVVNPHWLLLVTALLLGYVAIQVMIGRGVGQREPSRAPTRWGFAGVGLVAGFTSGLLGVGGGIVMVPAFTTFLGMPLKRALGTSLVVIVVLVIPGTLVHWSLGHIDWAIFLVVTAGAVVGARLGATIALGTRERTLRLVVGSFLLVIALLYGADELVTVLGGSEA